jgi:hypothetical protein
VDTGGDLWWQWYWLRRHVLQIADSFQQMREGITRFIDRWGPPDPLPPDLVIVKGFLDGQVPPAPVKNAATEKDAPTAAEVVAWGQKRKAILADIKKHPEIQKLGRNRAARELGKLGHSEPYARHILTAQRRAGGSEKFAPGKIIHLGDRQKV